MCIVYKIINMLIYFEPSGDCDSRGTGLVLAPLPARKRLWEANDEIAWKLETDRDSKPGPCAHTTDTSFSSTTFGLATNGELVSLDMGQGQNYCSNAAISLRTQQSLLSGGKPSLSKGRANWEDWCAGMDGLGGLVMLAASLLQ
jgi:hypothetical protein